jgi:hypothetical protein
MRPPLVTTIRLSTLNPLRGILAGILSLGLAVACATQLPRERVAPTVWRLNEVSRVAGLTTEVVGSPKVVGSGARTAVAFDGKGDGLLVPSNPLEGWSAFTIEVRFKPDGNGGEEQRFLHIEDARKQRVLIETRLTPDKQWALDTFLFQDATHKLTLLDRTRLHPADRWYWVALVYDGRKMSHYIDGVLELEGEVAFGPMTAGRTSIGVRQNLVSWFKGEIAEARFTPAALSAPQLQAKP